MALDRNRCESCGADLPVSRGPVTCTFCGAIFKPSGAGASGALLLAADLRTSEVPGWNRYHQDKWTAAGGVLTARCPAQSANLALLATPGPLGDLDASMTVRFLEGVPDRAYAGFEARNSGAGFYSVNLSMQGTFQIGRYDGAAWAPPLVAWAWHPAVKKERGAPCTIRIVLVGKTIRLFLNGQLATSVQDPTLSQGTLRVFVNPAGGPTVIELSELEVREPAE